MESYGKLIEIWGNITSVKKENSPFDISDYEKRLVDYFHVGPYYYYIFDVSNTKFEFISDNMATILGYDPKSIGVAEFVEKIHPEDLPYFVQCENAIVEFSKTISPEQLLNYKISYDYRIKKKDGNYIRILQQVITIDMDKESGKIFKTLGIHTNITHIKPLESANNESVLSFIGMHGQRSYSKTRGELLDIREESFSMLTDRQKQIVSCLMNGMSSQEIADNLFISKNTVDTHRRKILEIMRVSNTQQLIVKILKMGWL